MSEVLTLEEIQTRYPGEWVLVGEPETDDALRVQRGTVIHHSPDRDEVYRRAVELRPGRFATLFTGPFPEEPVIVV